MFTESASLNSPWIETVFELRQWICNASIVNFIDTVNEREDTHFHSKYMIILCESKNTHSHTHINTLAHTFLFLNMYIFRNLCYFYKNGTKNASAHFWTYMFRSLLHFFLFLFFRTQFRKVYCGRMISDKQAKNLHEKIHFPYGCDTNWCDIWIGLGL